MTCTANSFACRWTSPTARCSATSATRSGTSTGSSSSQGDLLEKFRGLFGDERESYQDAIDRHYSEGAPSGWQDEFISQYATMHPWEDFAETFAHYLHICDTVETASAYGLATVASPKQFSSFRDLVNGVWVPLSIALNQINRSMGKDPLYPFVIPPPVLDKLEFVARLPRDSGKSGPE